MSLLNIECPKCGMENAYFNGLQFECPDCNHTWGELSEDQIEEYEED